MAGVDPLLEVNRCRVERADGWAVGLPSLELLPGQVVALYGPSGCGKTSVLRGLFGLLPPDATTVTGLVRWMGRDLAIASPAERLHILRHEVSFLAQDAHAALDPLQALGAQIAAATYRSEADAVAMLGNLGVADAAAVGRRLPHQVSGGQAQRALLAIAFLRGSQVLVADEPSASLDGGSYAELLAHLQQLRQRGTALLLATHDLRLLRDLDARVFTARAGSFLPGEPHAAPWPSRGAGHGVGSLPVLAATGLTVAYGPRVVLDGVDFALRRGEVVAITGESGAGKTTLARVLAGHRAPDRGHVERPPRRTAVQLVCQDAHGSLTPGRSVRSLVAEAVAPFFALDRTATTLQLRPSVVERAVATLSGGERRRAALLRALAVHPDVLVLDEPTASLDREAAVAVLEVLLGLQAERGLALVLVTHDLELARAVADRVLVLQGGRLCPC